ncbi:MAG: GNAT family N-acetyltransferase [Ignavibacteria bacterium]|nr:GNAT family N-acetyltransferase [Ignavibacteria bacterium]
MVANKDDSLKLTTNKYFLRGLVLDDAEEILFLRSDERILEHIDIEKAETLEDAKEFIEKINRGDDGWLFWGITEKNNSKVIGTICLWNIEAAESKADIGFVLHPDYWGKGVTQEVIPAVINFGLQKVKLKYIIGEAMPKNLKSIKLMEKFGFRYKKESGDYSVYSLTALDWLKKQFEKKKHPVILSELNIPSSLQVALLAPHPDDFDAIGITMRALHENGNTINLAVLTTGVSGVEDVYAAKRGSGDKAAIREEEQKASIQFFGLPQEQITFLRLENDETKHMAVTENNFARTKEFWDGHTPDIVFLPHGNDTNTDHQRTYAMFKKILEAESKPVIAFLNKDPKTIGIRNDVITTFDETEAAWKGELLRFHKSQHERNLRTRNHGFDERILSVNRKDAEELCLQDKYVEIFELEFHPAKIK